jgi:hypothetical protein
MTATERDLLALEKKFWTGDTKFYRDNVDDTCLVAFGEDSEGYPEFELYVTLGMIPDVPTNFLQLLSLGLNERPRELIALERWLAAFTPEDDVWPGRFSILSLRSGRRAPARISLYLRPAEFEMPIRAMKAA